MDVILSNLKLLFKDNRGATAVEYGLIVALMFLASMVAIKNYAAEAAIMFGKITSAVQSAGS
jgi:pilus assembly protein Flp/PilA